MKTRSSSSVRGLVACLAALQFAVFVVGVGGVLTVDVARTYVAGEGHYSKGEKRAAYQLRAYATSGQEAHYLAYEQAMAAPRAFALARIVLENPEFAGVHAERALARAGLRESETPFVVWSYRLLGETPLLRPAMETWRAADRNLAAIESLGLKIRTYLSAGAADRLDLGQALAELDARDARQTVLQNRFSAQIGDASEAVKSYVVVGMLAMTLAIIAAGAALGRRTIRRLAEAAEALESERRLFRDIALTASDWIWTTDSALKFDYVSERMRDLTGVDPARLTGALLGEALPAGPVIDMDPEDRARVEANLAACRAFREVVYCYRIDPSGEALWCRISGTPAWARDGSFAGYRGTGTEISSEVRARQEVRDRQELLETTFEAMPQGVVVVDARARVKAGNGQVLDMLGAPADAPRAGCCLAAFLGLGAADRPGVVGVESCLRALPGKLRVRGEGRLELTRPDGRVLEVGVEGLPSGGAVAIFDDITERARSAAELRRARDAAQEASRAKSAFLASMSHELRTPLNAIIGYSEVMREEIMGPVGNPRYVGYVAAIHDSGRFLLELIQDVLSLSKLEIGDGRFEPEVLSLGEALDAALVVLGEASAARVTAEGDRAALVWFDRRALTQVLVNLISNALKFGGDDGASVVLRGGGTPAIEVADRGPGIPPEEIPRVVEPFYTKTRSGMTAAGEQEGSGIGLAVTKKLLEAGGGALRIESVLGEGTRATAELRAAAGALQAAE